MFRFLTRVCALALVAGAAHAAYPERPIRMIVPFAPGGGADITARVVADTLGKKLGQPVIVENKAGAGGMIGAAAVARAEPDGYTLLYTTPGQQMTLPYLMKTMPYDPADLRPVSQVSLAPSVLVVNRKLGVRTLQQLIDLARKQPGELNFVSAGIGASSHLNGELLQILAGIRLQHIPYKGTGDAVKDLVGGNGDIAIDTVGIYTSFIKDGRLIPLGVTTTEELPLLPGVPPLSRTLPGYDASPINYITVPKATPEAVVQKLAAALQATIAEPEVKQRMLEQGILAIANTPDQMAELLRKEQARWREVIEKAHIPKQ
ncbi:MULTISPECIES: Bug family tripartite tricarboxylate transporter substrate binding protein [Alcaligenaceae]|uniref:Bug family tripartite tricarboxylate transporter substrate binding protein n=1 Tax=Bordetella genomosp. 10 TaxID=1416804 RepID=UPI000B9E1AAD|nr:tripartite tricarboxylate transporter substrate-binding protein [Bordetella genomosp. 10]